MFFKGKETFEHAGHSANFVTTWGITDAERKKKEFKKRRFENRAMRNSARLRLLLARYCLNQIPKFGNRSRPYSWSEVIHRAGGESIFAAFE